MGDVMDDPLDELIRREQTRFYGKYRGTVVANNDDNQQGRLKVSVPAVLDTAELWAMPCVPYAGAGVGLFALPESGTGVWVEFEGGDPSYPIWTGCFWGSGQLPDQSDAAIKIWKTAALTIRLDDNAAELLVTSTSGGQVKIVDVVLSEAGGASHEVGSGGVNSSKGGSVAITDSGVAINGSVLKVGKAGP
ncbi:MAG: baseplate assembly protein [Actinomycetia bacterium]|nr:baseplate assembly protein [Actinomycetes bacterium]